MSADPSQPVTFGILQVDGVREELRQAHGDYPAMFERMLREAAPNLSLRFEVFDVLAGELPHPLERADVYLITGSRYSVYDDRQWIRRLEAFVRQLHRARHPLIGICFGHQLIARALGGEACPHPGGWAIGAHRMRVLSRREWMSPTLDHFSLLCSHRDQVTRLPAGAELLAGNDFCPIGAFAVGEHMLAFQGHPEFTVPYSAALMELRREVLGEELVAAGLASLSGPLHSDPIAHWLVNFALLARRSRGASATKEETQ